MLSTVCARSSQFDCFWTIWSETCWLVSRNCANSVTDTDSQLCKTFPQGTQPALKNVFYVLSWHSLLGLKTRRPDSRTWQTDRQTDTQRGRANRSNFVKELKLFQAAVLRMDLYTCDLYKPLPCDCWLSLLHNIKHFHFRLTDRLIDRQDNTAAGMPLATTCSGCFINVTSWLQLLVQDHWPPWGKSYPSHLFVPWFKRDISLFGEPMFFITAYLCRTPLSFAVFVRFFVSARRSFGGSIPSFGVSYRSSLGLQLWRRESGKENQKYIWLLTASSSWQHIAKVTDCRFLWLFFFLFLFFCAWLVYKIDSLITKKTSTCFQQPFHPFAGSFLFKYGCLYKVLFRSHDKQLCIAPDRLSVLSLQSTAC